jgi:hypothetical protein
VGLSVAALAPQAASADDAARISRLESEIQLLRTQINEQNRRIQRLEDELSRRAGAPAIAPQPRKRVNEMRTDPAAATARLPWHSPEAWDRVAKGMTAEEVTTILGEPTVVESFEPFKTLFYRGSVSGGASINGHVNLRDDRVVAVSKPAF